MSPTYDRIGKTYDQTRRADPEITKQLIEWLEVRDGNGLYLDIGCGSGNYTQALASKGLHIEGIDISSAMLAKAKQKYGHLSFHLNDATQLPFADHRFAGAISVFATHHIDNLEAMFEEAYRVIRAGNLVIFTATPEQMAGYWLCHYFPDTMKQGINLMASFSLIAQALQQAGFSSVKQKPFFISNGLQDWFLHAGKYRPEIYLKLAVRQGMSFFQLFREHSEIESGLNQLKEDIETGHIKDVIHRFENDLGDCLFIVAKKQP